MLTPSSSMLSLSCTSPQNQNLLLTSLELPFKSQTELVLTDIGYSPLRLISITKELVSASQPVHISESPDEDHAEWHVVFDLTVPGWLPATSIFGDNDGDSAASVSYALYACACFLSAIPNLNLCPRPSPANPCHPLICSSSSLWPSPAHSCTTRHSSSHPAPSVIPNHCATPCPSTGSQCTLVASNCRVVPA